MKDQSVIPKKYQNVGSGANYILSSCLHSLRAISPYRLKSKFKFFKKYEPIFKDILSKSTIFVLRGDGAVSYTHLTLPTILLV